MFSLKLVPPQRCMQAGELVIGSICLAVGWHREQVPVLWASKRSVLRCWRREQVPAREDAINRSVLRCWCREQVPAHFLFLVSPSHGSSLPWLGAPFRFLLLFTVFIFIYNKLLEKPLSGCLSPCLSPAGKNAGLTKFILCLNADFN